MKVERGFDRFISLKEFNLASKNYLVGDTCAFGAEVFVCNETSTGKGECLPPFPAAANYWFSASSPENGSSRFMPICNFTNECLGYVVRDSCCAEAEIIILGVVDAFP
ncbi:hypothetical protein Fmac_013343 [Flemingia macrophylla]|uniref:MATH domain-containing protein n=1 Tax=Flemingia macrophylla TaxID=520843 RepID=A0ABD1MTQ6_9FABA